MYEKKGNKKIVKNQEREVLLKSKLKTIAPPPPGNASCQVRKKWLISLLN